MAEQKSASTPEPVKPNPKPEINLSKRQRIIRGTAAGLLMFAILANVVTVAIPFDTSYSHPVNYARSGKLYTYLYYYDEILGDPNCNAWLDDIAAKFDYVYIIAPWGTYFKSNTTLDEVGLTNVTRIMKALGDRGCNVVVHTWYSSYHPKWLEFDVPELIGTEVRWAGMSIDNPHYDTLMFTNLQYLKLLTGYFLGQSVSNIIGFCLDDETSSDNWMKVCMESTKFLHSVNSNWNITSMFSNERRYHMAGVMDYLALDPYDDDIGVMEKIRYGHSLGVGKLSVLLNGMDNDTEENGLRMRRQAWIAWFMGADSIGWWCYNIYWHGFRGGVPNNWFFMPYHTNGPQITNKSQAITDFNSDIILLRALESKRLASIESGNSILTQQIETGLQTAYSYAKSNDFTTAVQKLQEVAAL